MKLRVGIAAAAGLAAVLWLHLTRGYPYSLAVVVGLAVALLTWAILRTARRLKDLYQPRE